MDENEHERLSNITLKIQIKLKKQHFLLSTLYHVGIKEIQKQICYKVFLPKDPD
jgi:hypothetical protein